MRRFLTLAKYLPAVLCGLLVVAWVVSLIWPVGLICWRSAFVFRDGNVDAWSTIPARYFRVIFPQTTFPYGVNSFAGQVDYYATNGNWQVSLPIPAVLTLLLPLAVGPFIRFRFPLWSWFAWTALIAVELAYYLR